MSDKINVEMLAALKGLYETGAPEGISLTAEEMRARFDYAKAMIQEAEAQDPAPLLIDPASIPWRYLAEDVTRMIATVQIGTCSFHLEAIEVETMIGDEPPEAVGDNDQTLDDAYRLADGDGQFETLSIGGRDYVVFMTPFCD